MSLWSPTPFLRCGWPFQLVQSSTIVYCSLEFGHDGPVCCLLDGTGTTVAAAPRFGAQGTRK